MPTTPRVAATSSPVGRDVRRQREVVAEQLVGAVDEVDLHRDEPGTRLPVPPGRSAGRGPDRSRPGWRNWAEPGENPQVGRPNEPKNTSCRGARPEDGGPR